MRITGGKLKGKQIVSRFPAHVRPTTDMMREVIFNMLSVTFPPDDAQVLDLFSGTGIMSVEFASRNAETVTSVDTDGKNIKLQKEIKSGLQLQNWDIHKEDVFRFLENADQQWDIIFADPPYDLPGIQQLAVLGVKKLTEDGIMIIEHRPGILFQQASEKTKVHGSSAITIFVKK